MAIFPYNKIGQEIILYDNINKQPQPKDYFTIASGYDCKDPQNASGANVSSVGIRWTISRNDSQQNKQPPIGYPNRGITPCWFVLPDNVALCILTCIKNHSSNAKGCVINIPEIDKAIKEITARIAQQNSAQGAKNSSLQKNTPNSNKGGTKC